MFTILLHRSTLQTVCVYMREDFNTEAQSHPKMHVLRHRTCDTHNTRSSWNNSVVRKQK